MNEEQDTSQCGKRYFGKYRGTVFDNRDPEQRGRIIALVPDVSGNMPTTWALPCLAVTGMQTGMFTVPTKGSGVWIEYEQGDSDYPIWVGGFYGSPAEVPAMARIAPPDANAITLQTPKATGITISDGSGPTGGILLRHASGAFIAINDLGITLSTGKNAIITLQVNKVDVNNGALTII
jgi:uncharacterized protein involved in type VI secretion and phage assembly